MEMKLREQLRNIVAETIEIDDFEDNDRFGEDFGVDSMMVLELVARIEKECKITIPEEYFPEFQTFEDIVRVIEKRMAERV